MQLFDQQFVFSTQPWYRLARHSLFWLVVMLYFGLLYGIFPLRHYLNHGLEPVKALLISYAWSSLEAAIYMPNHMVLTYGILYLLLPHYLYKGQYLSMFAGVLLLGVLAAFVSIFQAIYIIGPLREANGLPTPELINIGYSFMAGLRGSTTVAGFATAIKIMKDWYLKQKALRQIQQEKFQAELQLLKSQIHPHFLFNTLNNLYALTLRKSEQSPAVVLRLSELLSYMLYDCNADEVPLEKEIAFIRNYVGLEQLRYGDRLDLSMSFHGDLQGKQIAPLLLIPFLENAFKHGTSEQLDQAWISLDLAVEGDTLRFKLINSRDPEEDHPERLGGIGLQNVRKRLDLLYPQRYELQILPEEDLFLVTLTLHLPETPALPNTHLIQTAAVS
ncbi:histidine kinase [Nibrella saemangeumensis]|uniref:Histidine kinase n=1 Tax=Nibrella saemangeumensis TaxID=1084526 RepID=A0ABP8NMB0_9BACT